MTHRRIALLALCAGLAAPAAASTSSYDLLIVACDSRNCKRIAEQTVSGGLASTVAAYNRNGLRLLIEPLARRIHEEDARVSLNITQSEDGASVLRSATFLAQRLETLVIQCTLRHGTFSPLTSFVNEGTTYQIWARLAAR